MTTWERKSADESAVADDLPGSADEIAVADDLPDPADASAVADDLPGLRKLPDPADHLPDPADHLPGPAISSKERYLGFLLLFPVAKYWFWKFAKIRESSFIYLVNE
jgi:hypothetical protein